MYLSSLPGPASSKTVTSRGRVVSFPPGTGGRVALLVCQSGSRGVGAGLARHGGLGRNGGTSRKKCWMDSTAISPARRLRRCGGPRFGRGARPRHLRAAAPAGRGDALRFRQWRGGDRSGPAYRSPRGPVVGASPALTDPRRAGVPRLPRRSLVWGAPP